ncbi:alkyl hydroperoxide reductase AhpD [Desulfoluna limicola]|uniref:Alkyl hydroperoxide reductase AhpD n=1 Tax=Desulfoluna limicola TaxID=2810562 RepID=A0ABN6F2M1_9BACT|nr:carboxymuconolactone decarboxylase family protein [Desulfoluna limicola]BCS95751.1 alkyl hydroperoxide reductase AhpD [Desulfoluna limicola]
MAKDPSDMLNDLGQGMATLQEECPELMGAFVKMDQAAYVEAELERKTKELIGLAVALYARCEYCMAIHTKQALEEGATREEILEAASVAVAFGGSPSMAYLATTVVKSLDEFDV